MIVWGYADADHALAYGDHTPEQCGDWCSFPTGNEPYLTFEVLLYSTGSDFPTVRGHLNWQAVERLLSFMFAMNGGSCVYYAPQGQGVVVGPRRTYRPIPSRV